MNAEHPTDPTRAADPTHVPHDFIQAAASGYPSGDGPGPDATMDGPGAAPPQAGSPAWWTARRKVAAAGAALVVAVGAGGAGAIGAMALAGPNTVFASPSSVSPVSSSSGNSTTAQVAAAVQPSVVSITATSPGAQSTGSGVILRSNGVIMTNAHVVSGATRVTVKFSNGKTAPAQVFGSDTAKDIAVIKASGVSGLKPATLGDSGQLAVGDSVLAVGSPLGLDGSVTSGIVSALGRTVSEGGSEQDQGAYPYGMRSAPQQSASINNAIQTDAAINPGNSGGALVDSAGQVIGINTAIATTSGTSGSIGVGFAIPMNDAKKVANSIITKGGNSVA
jgi:putative serine protease PepD